MSDSWYWWSYRILGYAGNGSVQFNAVVDLCANPPCTEDLAEIERVHEAALAYPGVSTATTIGPIRASKKHFA